MLPPAEIRLGDSVELSVCNLDVFYKDVISHQRTEATLFINGLDTGIHPEAKDFGSGTLRFHLERNDTNQSSYDSSEWIFVDLRAAGALAYGGLAGESLIDQVTENAAPRGPVTVPETLPVEASCA